MHKIAVCMLTCDRAEYTQQTLRTFSHFNDLSKLILLHGDDGSTSQDNCGIAAHHGFETVTVSPQRRGVSAMTGTMMQAAASYGADWVLNLENDSISERPVPFEILDQVTDDIYCVRMYGTYRGLDDTQPCYTYHAGKDNIPVTWEPWLDGWEIANTHWGFSPAITRIAEAVAFTDNIRHEDDAILRSGLIDGLSVRPTTNIISHIGTTRTPGFVY